MKAIGAALLLLASISVCRVQAVPTAGSSDLSPEDRLFNAGNDAQRAGKFAQSIEFYEQAIKLNPKDADALLALGLAYAKLKKFNQAELYLSKSLLVSPMSFSANEELGVVLAQQGKYAEARRAYARASKLIKKTFERTLHENNMASLAERERQPYGKKRDYARKQAPSALSNHAHNR